MTGACEVNTFQGVIIRLDEAVEEISKWFLQHRYTG